MIKCKHKILKKAFLLVLQFFALGVIAQSPSLINYQGVARLADGTPLDNKTISIKFDIHQVSATGSVVATETQTVQTNNLGLFITQIGKTTNLGTVSWQTNLMFLQVWLDTSATGSNFINLGTQQMVSAPYALHASSVPSSYTNNILTIGSSTYALSPTIAVTPNTSITVSGLGTVTSAGTNTFDINIPSPTFTGQGATTVNGTYPNYTVSSAVPTIAVSSTPAPAPSVSNSGSSYSINIPAPTFTNAGPATITGAYPNFTINSSAGTTYTNGTGISISSGSVINNTLPHITPTVAITTTAAAGASVTSSGNSFSINVPAPTFTNSGPATITGTYPNYTITSSAGVTYTNGAGISITSGSIINSSPNITPTVVVTTTAAPSASVTSSGSSFSVNVPAPTFTNSGPATITGTYPNYTITSSAGVTYTSGAGISITSGSIINSSPNITPTVVVTTTAAPSASVTSSGSSFSVNIPAPTFANTGPSTISGAYPNFTINSTAVPNTSITVTSTAAAGPSVGVVGTNSFNINIPPNTNAWSTTGNAGTSTLTNFIGTTDANDLNFKTNGVLAVVINTLGNMGIGSTTANAPLQFNNSITGRKVVLWEGANNDNQVYGLGITLNTLRYQVDASTAKHIFYSGINTTSSRELLRIEGDGRIGVNNAAPTATLDVAGTVKIADGSQGLGKVLTSDALGNATWQTAASGWGLTGNAGTSTLTNFIGTTDNAALMFKVNNQVSGAIDPILQNAYFGYSSGAANTTGNLNAGVGYQALSANNTGINNTAIGGRALSANTTGSGNTAVGSSALLQNLAGIFNTAMGLNASRGNTSGSDNTALGRDALYNNSTGSDNVAIGYQAGFSSTGSSNVFIGTTAGYSETSSNKLYISNTSSSVSPLVYGDFANGKLGINTTTLSAALTVDNQSVTTRDGIYLTNTRDQVGSGMPLWIDIVTSGQTFGTNTYGRMIRLNNINTSQFYDMGIGSTNNFFIANGNNYSPAAVNISTLGNVGINTAAPTASLHVVGTTRLVDGTQGAGKVLTSDASGNATWQTATAPSKVRSIDLMPGSFNSNNFAGSVVFSTVGGWAIPCIQYPDGNAASYAVITVVMPADWNGATISSCKLLYSSPSTSGNFKMSVYHAPISAGQTVSQGQSGFPYTLSPSTTSEYLMEASISLVGITSGTKILNFIVWRNGTDVGDTNTGVLNVYGVKIEYND